MRSARTVLLNSLSLIVLCHYIDVRRLHALPLSRVHACLRPLPDHLLLCVGGVGCQLSCHAKNNLLLRRRYRRLWLWLTALLSLHLALVLLLLLLHVHLKLCIWRHTLSHYVVSHTHRYLLWLLLPLHWRRLHLLLEMLHILELLHALLKGLSHATGLVRHSHLLLLLLLLSCLHLLTVDRPGTRQLGKFSVHELYIGILGSSVNILSTISPQHSTNLIRRTVE